MNRHHTSRAGRAIVASSVMLWPLCASTAFAQSSTSLTDQAVSPVTSVTTSSTYVGEFFANLTPDFLLWSAGVAMLLLTIAVITRMALNERKHGRVRYPQYEARFDVY